MNKKTKRGLYLLIGAVCLIATATVLFAALNRRNEPVVSGAEGIVDYLGGFGWNVPEEPAGMKEVVIPAKFSEAYEVYNELQKAQGFDLTRYRADTVTLYTYRILNHPSDGDVFANILVFDGRIIGGDICSYALGGFMTGFDGKTV